ALWRSVDTGAVPAESHYGWGSRRSGRGGRCHDPRGGGARAESAGLKNWELRTAQGWLWHTHRVWFGCWFAADPFLIRPCLWCSLPLFQSVLVYRGRSSRRWAMAHKLLIGGRSEEHTSELQSR